MIANKGCLRDAAAPARRRLALGILYPWQESGLALIGDVEEARSCHRPEFPGSPVCRPAASAGFAILGFWCCGLANNGTARAGLRVHCEPALYRARAQGRADVNGYRAVAGPRRQYQRGRRSSARIAEARPGARPTAGQQCLGSPHGWALVSSNRAAVRSDPRRAACAVPARPRQAARTASFRHRTCWQSRATPAR